MDMNKLLKIIISLILFGIPLFSQQESQTKPLELPNYIIEGRGNVNIQGGVKQLPSKSIPLNKDELDSINSLQKEQSFLLPPKQVPNQITSRTYSKGFIRGEFGRFVTPLIECGYGINTKGYNLFGTINLEGSQGFIINSEYFKSKINIMSEYFAPDSFWIYGGSKTLTNISFDYRNINLYSISASPNRNFYNFSFDVISKGNFEGYEFKTGAGFEFLSLANSGRNNSDRNFNGLIELKNNTFDFHPGLRLALDLGSYRSIGSSFIDLSGFADINLDKLKLNGELGLQYGSGSTNASFADIKIIFNSEYLINSDFSIKSIIENKLQKYSFSSFAKINQYISDSIDVLFNNITQLKVSGYYHPEDNTFISTGLILGYGNRTPYFSNQDSSVFKIQYNSSVKFNYFIELDWRIGFDDILLMNFTFSSEKFTHNGKTLPYSEPLKIAINYSRKFFQKFGIVFGITYVNQRYADNINQIKLKGYFDPAFVLKWTFDDRFDANISVQNMFNSDIYHWNGYKERNLFISAGIKYKL